MGISNTKKAAHKVHSSTLISQRTNSNLSIYYLHEVLLILELSAILPIYHHALAPLLPTAIRNTNCSWHLWTAAIRDLELDLVPHQINMQHFPVPAEEYHPCYWKICKGHMLEEQMSTKDSKQNPHTSI